ncbi:hypothetical protein [Arabidopsis thaliana]|uniref:RNA-binding (RRM/RBD/RNP motifs) family protein n=1 Tax=Arabidopsis thaliana TaxID=3702 RepID=Q9SN93_ARATH|nr:RNA-binding (RRM/RBD/RNP motifs) family protein [Arabidopsis thaliana]AEE78163.1 RNA-binding (RRM/RBD/RNP motifs) family protein [Arabidopsis thaliana]CAB62038.1 hypothetical protein [Arabidopsis thaliana]|eukprot:NP_190231.1 RNA-binding (RRM/RBD/RNP motifs) family protein [Arabidopsis thaliana]
MPSGLFPVTWDAKYASSSDEEFEEFLESNILMLSNVHRKISELEILEFFQGCNCQVVLNKKREFRVEFPSHEEAMAALQNFNEVKLVGRTISLTRSTYPMYKIFCIKGFKNTLLPTVKRQVVNEIFENDFGYLYMYLGDQVDVEKTVLQKRKYLQVKECRMKGKVNKSLSSNWKTVAFSYSVLLSHISESFALHRPNTS